jgi:hypothetical protein
VAVLYEGRTINAKAWEYNVWQGNYAKEWLIRTVVAKINISKKAAPTSILATHTEKFVIGFVPDIVKKMIEESIEFVAIGTVYTIQKLENIDWFKDVTELLDTLDTNIVLFIVDCSEEFV